MREWVNVKEANPYPHEQPCLVSCFPSYFRWFIATDGFMVMNDDNEHLWSVYWLSSICLVSLPVSSSVDTHCMHDHFSPHTGRPSLRSSLNIPFCAYSPRFNHFPSHSFTLTMPFLNSCDNICQHPLSDSQSLILMENHSIFCCSWASQ